MKVTTSRDKASLNVHLQRLVWVSLSVPLVLIGLLVIALVTLRVDQIKTEIKDLSTLMATRVDAQLQAQIQSVQALSTSTPAPNRDDFDRIWHARLTEYERKFDLPILLANQDRQMRVHSRHPLGERLPTVPKTAGRSAFDEALHSMKPAVGDYVMGPVLKQPVVSVCVPLLEALPEKLVVLSIIPLSRLQKSLQTLAPPRGLGVWLKDSNQTVLAQSTGFHSYPLPEAWRMVLISEPLGVVPWTVQVTVEDLSFFTPFLVLAGLLLGGLMLTFWGTWWSASQLMGRITHALDRLISTFHQKDELWVGSHSSAETKISEVIAIEQELQRLRQAERDTQAAERARIAQDLHDGMQQDLLAIRLQLDQLHKSPTSAGSPTDISRLEQCRQQVQVAMVELDRIIYDLRPHRLSTVPFEDAIQAMVDQFSGTSELQVEFEWVGDPLLVDESRDEVQKTTFRLIQECLTNVHKHARASFVHVMVDTSQPHHLHVSISDDGVGLNDAQMRVSDGMGLIGLRRRLEALQGQLSIHRGHDGDPDCGTTVRAMIPL